MLLTIAMIAMNQSIDWVVYEGGQKNGKHIVFLAGDEEYRSEEGLPQLAKILAFRHGFKCTVLFSVNDKGEIDPEEHKNQPGLQLLETADLCVILLRFREWPDEQMKYFDAYVSKGKPILAMRTSTHAFDFKDGPYEKYGWQSKTWPGGFGKQILGETWISHWGKHGEQATRGILVPAEKSHPVLRGVEDVFCTTDVYEAHPPLDSNFLMYGSVRRALDPNSVPADDTKTTSKGTVQNINSPMMPIVWTRDNHTLTTTMGAATDLLNEGLRRLLVNGCYWLLGMDPPQKADVDFVGEYKPSQYGFGGYKKGVKPSDLAQSVPGSKPRS